MLENPNIEELRIVFTPGIPKREVVSGYVIWSSISCGERPCHLVKTICWFSPISGMASTATGSVGKKPVSQLKGALTTPQPTNRASSRTATSLFSMRNLMLLFSITFDVLDNWNYVLQKMTNTSFSPRYSTCGIGLHSKNLTNQIKKVWCITCTSRLTKGRG